MSAEHVAICACANAVHVPLASIAQAFSVWCVHTVNENMHRVLRASCRVRARPSVRPSIKQPRAVWDNVGGTESVHALSRIARVRPQLGLV